MKSILSLDRTLCVDFFSDPDGGYGFEHLRADPEDAARWSIVGGFSSRRFDTAADAAVAARAAVVWLGEVESLGSWEAWHARQLDT